MTFFKKVIGKMVENNLVWKLLKPLVKIGKFLSYKREEQGYIKEQEIDAVTVRNSISAVEKIFCDRIVLHGPFKGMKYPELESVGSELYPKLIGSYEREIEGIIEMICRNKYSEIIDIGCAEGYYAVGLALRIQDSKVFAFDTSEKARILCKKMAEFNAVADRIFVDSFCTPETLGTFPFTGHGLIICDCEGFEKELFNDSNIKNLKHCDILIEMHDFFDRTISGKLRHLFTSTHAMIEINSIKDSTKAERYHYAEVRNFDFNVKKVVFKEGRPEIMQWLFLVPLERNKI